MLEISQTPASPLACTGTEGFDAVEFGALDEFAVDVDDASTPADVLVHAAAKVEVVDGAGC